MSNAKCNFCGQESFDRKRVEYIYRYKGKYLLIPNMPVEVCRNCGMKYYDGKAMEEAEKAFFAIEGNIEKPDSYIQIPTKSLV